MCKKLFFSILVMVALGLLVNPLAQAATRTWDHEGGDNRWDTAANWSNDKIPVGSDTARIVLTGADEARIDAAVAAALGKIQVGWLVDDVALAGDLRILGGTLDMTKASQVGRKSTGRLFVEGGILNARAIDIGDDAGGVGTFTMSDGVMNCGNSDVDWKTLFIGRDSATGSATISGGVLSTGTINVGHKLDSVGSLLISGGIINIGEALNTNAFTIANDGATGTATILDGIINVSGNVNIGSDAGPDNLVPSDGILDMLGGTINVGTEGVDLRNFRIGHNDGVGVVNMSDGTVNINGGLIIGSTFIQIIEDPYEEIPHPGTGRLTMTGGLITIPDANSLQIGTNGSTGQLDLWGGTIMAGALEIGEPGSGGLLDVRKGTLILEGDRTEAILGYVDAGLLTASEGWELLYDYDVSNVGKTTVTAIPEPATIALLGLGGLLFRRRRK